MKIAILIKFGKNYSGGRYHGWMVAECVGGALRAPLETAVRRGWSADETSARRAASETRRPGLPRSTEFHARRRSNTRRIIRYVVCGSRSRRPPGDLSDQYVRRGLV